MLDCTDNVAIRNLLNQRARQHKVPLVSSAAIQLEGNGTASPGRRMNPATPVSSTLFGDQALTCVEAGVLARWWDWWAAPQALEAINAGGHRPAKLQRPPP